MFECTAAGDFEDICNCRQFYKCNHNGANPVVTPCAGGTVYDGRICNWEYNVNMDEVCSQVRYFVIVSLFCISFCSVNHLLGEK